MPVVISGSMIDNKAGEHYNHENLFMHRKRYHPSTIIEVARLAGVSPSTVSRVLNGTAVVAPETEQRVRAAIAQLNFSPHPAARQLVSQRTNTIGLLLPEISSEFFRPKNMNKDITTRNIPVMTLFSSSFTIRVTNLD